MTDSPRPTREQIAELRKLEAAATPGEWWPPHYSTGRAGPCRCQYVLCGTLMGAICTIHSAETEPDGDNPPREQAVANGLLIAVARDALPGLLAAAEDAERFRAIATYAVGLMPPGMDRERLAAELRAK